MKKQFVISFLCVASLLAAYPAYAVASEQDIRKRIQRLEDELTLLKRQQEVAEEQSKAAAEKTAHVELGKSGLKITSPDKKYELSLRGNVQVDARQFLNDESSADRDEILARRIRPVLEVRAGDASLRLMPDFAGSTTRILDAHVDYKWADELQFRAGKFKPPVGLERLQSAADMFFIERGHPSNLAPNRDLGVMVYGNVLDNQLDYQLGLFSGNQDLGNTDSDDDDKEDIVARLFAQPLPGLGVGLAGSLGDREGTSTKTILGTYKTPGQQDFFRYRSDAFASGQHWRLYPQAYWYYKNIGLLAEYAISNQYISRGSARAELQHTALQVAASYVITGEDVNFRGGIKPFASVDEGGPGAFEITARFGQTDVDNATFITFADAAVSASLAQSYGVGINWYLNENFKLMSNYDFTQLNRGATGGDDRFDEHAWFTRTQLRF